MLVLPVPGPGPGMVKSHLMYQYGTYLVPGFQGSRYNQPMILSELESLVVVKAHKSIWISIEVMNQ